MLKAINLFVIGKINNFAIYFVHSILVQVFFSTMDPHSGHPRTGELCRQWAPTSFGGSFMYRRFSFLPQDEYEVPEGQG